MSNIKKYSAEKDGELKLSKNFAVKEFKSHDSDEVYIDFDNVQQLQQLRDYFEKPIRIIDGYCTASHDEKIDDAANSYHVKGMAVDIVMTGVSAKRVAMRASLMEFPCVLWYPNKMFTHIDTRTNKFRAIYFSNSLFYPEPTVTVNSGAKGNNVKWIQYMLNQVGFKLTVDGVYGSATTLAVKDFQRKCKLTVDGIFGAKTLFKLKEENTK